jgi:hypothetical protein
MHAEIFTYGDQIRHTYRIVVMVDGKLRDTRRAIPSTVTNVRNRLNAEWSNRADSVHAGPIPRLFTLTNSPGV